MQLHDNAKTTPKTRELLVDRVLQREWDVDSVAEAAGVSTRTVWKWLWRYRGEGAAASAPLWHSANTDVLDDLGRGAGVRRHLQDRVEPSGGRLREQSGPTARYLTSTGPSGLNCLDGSSSSSTHFPSFQYTR